MTDPQAHSWNAALDRANGPYASVLFWFTLAATVLVCVKVRMKLEWTNIAIMFAYLSSFFLRTNMFELNQMAKRVCYATASIIIWGMMYVFVFSMIKLRLALESDNLDDLGIKLRRLRRNGFYVATAFLIFAISDIFSLILATEGWLPVTREVFNALRCFPKLAIDFYIFSEFRSALNFFVMKKEEFNIRVLGHSRGLNAEAQTLVSLIKFLWALNIFNAVTHTIVASVYHSNLILGDHPSDHVKFWFRLLIMPLSWTVNFLTAIALLFLFMKQGAKALKKERSVTKVHMGELAKRSLIFNTQASESFEQTFSSSTVEGDDSDDMSITIKRPNMLQQFIQSSIFERP